MVPVHRVSVGDIVVWTDNHGQQQQGLVMQVSRVSDSALVAPQRAPIKGYWVQDPFWVDSTLLFVKD